MANQGDIEDETTHCREWLLKEGWTTKPQGDQEVQEVLENVLRRTQENTSQQPHKSFDETVFVRAGHGLATVSDYDSTSGLWKVTYSDGIQQELDLFELNSLANQDQGAVPLAEHRSSNAGREAAAEGLDDPLAVLRKGRSDLPSRKLLVNRIPGMVLRPPIGEPIQRAFDAALDRAEKQTALICELEKGMEASSQRIYDLEMDKGEEIQRALDLAVQQQRSRQEDMDNVLSALEKSVQNAKMSASLGVTDTRIQSEEFVKEIADMKAAAKVARQANVQERCAMDMVGGSLLDLKLALDENTAGDNQLAKSVERIREFMARPKLKKKKKKKKKRGSSVDQAVVDAIKEKVQKLQDLEAKLEAKSKLQAELLEKNARALEEQDMKMQRGHEISLLGAKKSEELANSLKARLGFDETHSVTEIKEVYKEKQRRASMKAAGAVAILFTKRRRSTLSGLKRAASLSEVKEEDETAAAPPVAAAAAPTVQDPPTPAAVVPRLEERQEAEERVGSEPPAKTKVAIRDSERAGGEQQQEQQEKQEEGKLKVEAVAVVDAVVEEEEKEEEGQDPLLAEGEEDDEHLLLATMPLLESEGDDETLRLQKELRVHREEREVHEAMVRAAREDYEARQAQSLAHAEKLRLQLEKEKSRLVKVRQASVRATAFLVKYDPSQLQAPAAAAAAAAAAGADGGSGGGDDLDEGSSRPHTPDLMKLQQLSPLNVASPSKAVVSAEGVKDDGTWDPKDPPQFLRPTLELLDNAEARQAEVRRQCQRVEDVVASLAAQCEAVQEQGKSFDEALDVLEDVLLDLEGRKAEAEDVPRLENRVEGLERAHAERDASGGGLITMEQLSVRLPLTERAVHDLRVRSVLEQQVQSLALAKGDSNVLTAQMSGLSATVRTLVDDARQQDRYGVDRALRTIALRQDKATQDFDVFAASFAKSTERVTERMRAVLSESAAPKLIRKLRTQTANTVEAAVAAQAEKLARQGKALRGVQGSLHRAPGEGAVQRVVAVCLDSALKAKDAEMSKLSGLLHQLREEQRETLTREEALALATAKVGHILDGELGVYRRPPPGLSSLSEGGSFRPGGDGTPSLPVAQGQYSLPGSLSAATSQTHPRTPATEGDDLY